MIECFYNGIIKSETLVSHPSLNELLIVIHVSVSVALHTKMFPSKQPRYAV